MTLPTPVTPKPSPTKAAPTKAAPAPTKAAPKPTKAAPPPAPPAAPAAPTAPPADVYYKNCTAVWDAIGRPLYAGEPGYAAPRLDRDSDGVACEERP